MSPYSTIEITREKAEEMVRNVRRKLNPDEVSMQQTNKLATY